MKNIAHLLTSFILLILIACSGSDTYRGAWKATDTEGKKFEMQFEAKSFTLKDEAGETKTYEYTQHSIKTSNSIKTYGITLEDGRKYLIYFPYPQNQSAAIIKDENEFILYTISRTNYLTEEEIYKLK